MNKGNYGKSDSNNLSLDDLTEVLQDPCRVLVVEPLTGAQFITTYGSNEIEIIKKVSLERAVNEKLMNLADEKVIYYGSIDEITHTILNPHFFDIWREDAYGKQPELAATKAQELSLVD